MSVAYSELSFGAKHAKRFDAPELRLLDFKVFESGTNECKRDLNTCPGIGRTADDLVLVCAAADFTDNEFICIRVGINFQDLTDDDIAKLPRNWLDTIDFETRHGELLYQFFGA
jgi:hypothetical protein